MVKEVKRRRIIVMGLLVCAIELQQREKMVFRSCRRPNEKQKTRRGLTLMRRSSRKIWWTRHGVVVVEREFKVVRSCRVKEQKTG